MPLDPSISLRGVPVSIDSPLRAAGQALSLKQLMLQTRGLQEASQRESALANLFRNNPQYADRETGLPTPQGIQAVYALDPQAGMKLAQQLQTGQHLRLNIDNTQGQIDDRKAKAAAEADLKQNNAFVSAYDIAVANGATPQAAHQLANKVAGFSTPKTIEELRPLVTSPKEVSAAAERKADNLSAQDTPFMKELLARGVVRGSAEWNKELKKHTDRSGAPTAVMLGQSPVANPLGNDPNFWYEYYDKTKTLPPMAWGQAGNPTRELFLKGFPEWKKKQGGTASDTAASQAEFRSNGAALTALTKDLNTFEPYKRMLDKNADVAIQLGKKIYQTDAKLANRPLNWLRQNATNNPDVAEYLAQMRIVGTEAARVITNPRIVGQLTDQARSEIDAVIDGNAPIAVVERVLNRLKQDGNNRFDAMREQQEGLVNQLKNAPVIKPLAGDAGGSGKSLKWEELK